jgi:hypothetical protein
MTVLENISNLCRNRIGLACVRESKECDFSYLKLLPSFKPRPSNRQHPETFDLKYCQQILAICHSS